MSKLIDISNQTFGYWKVLYRVPNKNGRTYWRCLCTACNQEKDVASAHLRRGKSTNCGCVRVERMRQANIKQEIGNQYGFLLVQREVTSDESPRPDKEGVFWNCTCLKCGRENVVVFGDYLRNGDTKSCGCLVSINESKIAQMLDSLSFRYQQQVSFDALFSNNNKNNKLYFDFGVYDENMLLYLIEYDGVQHFEKGHFNGNFQVTRNNDIQKNQFCFENNIPLIRIPYYSNYCLDDLQLKTTNFLLKPETECLYYEKREGGQEID